VYPLEVEFNFSLLFFNAPKVKGDFIMIYGYSRVSTKCQAKDGNSLESQEKALREAGATKIFTDAFTGTKTDRPEFDKLIAEIKAGDTLVVTKLVRSVCQKYVAGE